MLHGERLKWGAVLKPGCQNVIECTTKSVEMVPEANSMTTGGSVLDLKTLSKKCSVSSNFRVILGFKIKVSFLFLLPSRIRVCITPSVTAVSTAARASGESSWTRVTPPPPASSGCLREPTPPSWSTSTGAPTEATEPWNQASFKEKDHETMITFDQVHNKVMTFISPCFFRN